ncbi:MAG: glycosyltransferase family 2 protein [Bacilli bacterium]|nr:glycosyltransferase family 2 protein [Bacilli bacterium]MBR3049362.1 glycosyltransferase family 2 protein [Bacilli bacterium]
MDKISIVVPCYNMEKKVKCCIDSIKKQSHKNFEVLMIDDGSKDKTAEVIKKNIKYDKRFKYLYKKNGGLSDARNFGIKKAKGNYICFIDSDDYIEDDYLECLYNSIKENNTDISISYFMRIYENKKSLNKINSSFNELIKHPAAWNKLYKIELFKNSDIEYPLGKWYEDLGTFPKLLMLSSKISIVKKPLYNYIQNSSSIMHTYSDRIYEIYDIVEDIKKFAKDNKVYRRYKDNIEFINIYHILIGTIYRASFREDFNVNIIRKIVNKVEKEYPNWYRNKGIKELPLPYKVYLNCIHHKRYKIIRLVISILNKRVDL